MDGERVSECSAQRARKTTVKFLFTNTIICLDRCVLFFSVNSESFWNNLHPVLSTLFCLLSLVSKNQPYKTIIGASESERTVCHLTPTDFDDFMA